MSAKRQSFFNDPPMSRPHLLHETPWLRLERIGHWDYVRRPHANECVGILAITPDEEILLVEQFRIPVGGRVIEIPAGIVGDEPEHLGETLAQTAARELLEETGWRAGSIRELIRTPTSAGLTSEIVHLFQASELTQEHAGGGVDAEEIVVHRVPLAGLDSWLAEQQARGCWIDFKIHAALRLAGI
ncbi:MAG: NUDIX hydrolase [Luteolibacter sp.]